MGRWRVGLALAGVLAAAYGVVLLISRVPAPSLLLVGLWLAGAILLHDAVWSPTVLGLGAAVSRVPPRARRYLQGALVVAGCVLVIAAPMVYVRGRQPVSKAILLQDVGANLLWLLVIIAASGVIVWLVRVFRDRRRSDAAEVSGTQPPGS